MKDNYVKVPSIYKKLRFAETENQVIYICAPVGFGKTAAVTYFYRNKSVCMMSGADGLLKDKLYVDDIRQSVIVIDDVSWITEDASKDYILELIEDKRKHLVLIGRARLPDWLKNVCIHNRFILADESDFLLDETLTGKLLESCGVTLPDTQVKDIAKYTQGFAVFIITTAYAMQNQKEYSEHVRQMARLDMFQYFDKEMYDKWSSDLRELLMAASNFEIFTLELLGMATGCAHVESLLVKAMEVGNFLTIHEDGSMELRYTLIRYLQWKQRIEEKNQWQMDIYARAGLYYEMKEDFSKALMYYEKADRKSEVAKLLIRNVRSHPGIGHYFELREYYLRLPEEEIMTSPVLIAGLSMLYSLILQPELSEEWYNHLVEYEKQAPRGSTQKKEAKSRIVYLDVGLPHRGSLHLIELIRNLAVLMLDKKAELPEFSVTSNLPSIMNGGKDFCEWSKADKELAIVMKKPVEVVLGKWGNGLVNIALAESMFEKGNKDIYEIMSMLNRGYTKADLGGKIEMCFVATSILCRIHLQKNQLQLARDEMREFSDKVRNSGAERMLPNIRAFEMGIALLEGKTVDIEAWVTQESPNENQEFNILERYRYIMKLRAYLALGRNDEALKLCERLKLYFTEYKRTYMYMENELLRAITLYRQSCDEWKDILSAILPKIEEYHFVHIIEKEGAALWPLLKELKELPVSDEFAEESMKALESMTMLYPNYLKVKSVLSEPLSNMEKQVLDMHIKGVESGQICELCAFSYNTLKFHNHNIYKKLGVSNKNDAIRIAKELGL